MLNKNVGFLAIDLPGHGYSSRIPSGMMYHYTVYLLAMKTVAQSFNWPKVSLMGHSYGGLLSYVYSMYFPTDIDYLICLEGVKPMIVPNLQADMIRTYDSFFKYNDYLSDAIEPPSYTIEEMKILLSEPNDNSILPEYTTYIMERNIAPSKVHSGKIIYLFKFWYFCIKLSFLGKYYMTRDPRIKIFSSIHFCQSELLELAQKMKMPIFIAKAKGFHYYEPKKNFYEVLNILKRTSVDCDFHYVEGGHHVHLNNPERLAGLVNNFIHKHNSKNRSDSLFSEDIVRDVKRNNYLMNKIF